MNRIKFSYNGNMIEFFTNVQGAKVMLLRARLVYADLNEIKRLRELAVIELRNFDSLMNMLNKAA